MKKQIDVLSLIPFGHANAISRKRLAQAMGVSDRAAREELKKLRINGYPIANEGDGDGYYQPVTPEEVQRQYNKTKSYAMSLFMQLKHLERRGARIDQVEMEEISHV